MGSAFFGLTSDLAPQMRLNLFSIIHQIVFHGKGGYDFLTIYNMPIWLRKFTYNEIRKFYKEEKEESERSSNENKSSLITPEGKVNAPEFMKQSQSRKFKNSYR